MLKALHFAELFLCKIFKYEIVFILFMYVLIVILRCLSRVLAA